MADYKQSTVAGTAWQRCSEVRIANPYQGFGGTPLVTFGEEQIINVGGKYVRQYVGELHKGFDPAATIAMLNPVTGESLGTTVTHGELYAILFSLYMQTAQERDAAQ
jgi:hypothetical protein